MKTENKKKNFRITVHTKVIVDKPECAVHVPWTVQEALDLKKKKKKKKGQKRKREKMQTQTQTWTNKTNTKYGLFVSMALMEFMS